MDKLPGLKEKNLSAMKDSLSMVCPMEREKYIVMHRKNWLRKFGSKVFVQLCWKMKI